MFQVALLTISDRGAAGDYEDRSGPLMAEIISAETDWIVNERVIVPDEMTPPVGVTPLPPIPATSLPLLQAAMLIAIAAVIALYKNDLFMVTNPRLTLARSSKCSG